jgi:hypothetical protein
MIEDLVPKWGFWDLLLWQTVFVAALWLVLIQYRPVAEHIVRCLRALVSRPTLRWLPLLALISVASADAASTEAVKAADPASFSELNLIFAHLVENGSTWLAFVSSLPILFGAGVLFLSAPTDETRRWYALMSVCLTVALTIRVGVVWHNLSQL